MVGLVVLGAERLEQAAICDEAERRLEFVRDEGHLNTVAPAELLHASARAVALGSASDAARALFAILCSCLTRARSAERCLRAWRLAFMRSPKPDFSIGDLQ